MTPICCDILNITPLTSVIYRICLKPQTPLKFKAGQYLLIHMGEDDKRPFSIASATHDSEIIELHIGADETNNYALQVLEKLKQNDTIEVSGGFGEAYYRPVKEPVVLIAGGTGFSYTYSILKQALHEAPETDMTLYWGTRKAEDLYFAEELTALASKYRYFTFIPVVEFPDATWKGRTGWVHRAVLNDYPSLSNYHVYIAGRFEMAKTAREDFVAKGLAQSALYGDAFAFI